MAEDARISTALPRHPKTVKLHRRLGALGCWHLVCLFLWVAENRADGNLAGMSDEDVEIAAGWNGQTGEFTRTLCEVRFLDGAEGARIVHDWAEHNPWAATRDKRIAAARAAAAVRWQGKNDADSMRTACGSHETAMPTTQPDPTKEKTASSNPDGFDQIVKAVFDYYLERTNRNPKTYEFTFFRKQKGISRLKECLRKTAGDLEKAKELGMLAVDGLVADDFHMGRDPKTNGKKFCEWEKHVFKSYEQMEGWWNRVPATPIKANGHEAYEATA